MADPASRAASRVVLVTGGARRLGAAIARGFARRGDRVVVHYHASVGDAEALQEAVTAEGGECALLHADLSDAAAAHRLVHQAAAVHGRLDVVVHSAAHWGAQELARVTPEEWDATADLNLRAPFFLAQAALERLADGGVFIQLGDHLAREAIWPRRVPHAITKSALPQLVRSFAAAGAPRVRFNGVVPGLVLPPEDFGEEARNRFLADVPLGRAGTPADVVQAIQFLVDAPYVTGVMLPVDGGRHLWR